MTQEIKPLASILSEADIKAHKEALKETNFELEDFYINPKCINGEIKMPILYLIKGPYFSKIMQGLIGPEVIADFAKRIYPTYLEINASIKEKRWNDLFPLLDPINLYDFFVMFEKEMTKEQRLQVFKFIYKHSERHFSEFDIKYFDELYEANKGRYDENKDVLIFRGIGSKSSYNGFSWTLDENVAKWFAIRGSEDGKILCCVVQPEDIIHYYNDTEQEIVVYPDRIKDRIKEYRTVIYKE